MWSDYEVLYTEDALNGLLSIRKIQRKEIRAFCSAARSDPGSYDLPEYTSASGNHFCRRTIKGVEVVYQIDHAVCEVRIYTLNPVPSA